MDAFNLLEERDQDDRWVEETRVKIDAAAASLDRGIVTMYPDATPNAGDRPCNQTSE
jgi:hypothetical protein